MQTAGRRRDPRGHSRRRRLEALPGRPGRPHRRAPGAPAARPGRALVRHEDLPQPRLPADAEREHRPDPGAGVLGLDRAAGRRNEDRRRRRRRRQHACVPGADRHVVPAGVPEGREEVDDAEGDRRALVPGTGLRTAGAAAARAGRVLPRHARRRDRGRPRRHVLAGRAGPSADRRTSPGSRRTRGSATTASSTSRRASASRRTRPRSWRRSRPPCATGWTSSTSRAAARRPTPRTTR